MKKFTLGLIAITTVGLSACGSQIAGEETSTAGQEEKSTIVVGTSPGPYS